ncbi:kinase domain protein [Xylaria sp. FL0064]|nr:kinase domain protein [Xylaria sp. FL0064]
MVKASTATKPRFLWQKRPQRLLALANRCFSASQPASSIPHMIGEPIEEGLLPGDRLKWFYPTQPGEVLDGRFKTIVKLGFGTGSTVWLAENLKFKRWRKSPLPRYVSIKIAALDTNATREMRASKRISNPTTSHEGLHLIRTPIDEFQLKGPEGTHSCFVYKPMRETISQFQHRLQRPKLDLRLFKFYTYCLLLSLDYLHTECRLIHTDIKDDNIMMNIENDAVLKDFVNFHKKNPLPNHVRTKDGRITYLSQPDFGPLRSTRLLPVLADFNTAFPGLDENHAHLAAIQSHCCRAPEVLLGCPWSYSVDIWSFGLLMWNLLEDVTLFEQPAGEDGEYDAHVHLAQMISLLGDPPEELIERERLLSKYQLQGGVINSRGKRCKNMNEFWGGPFFDDDKQIIRKDLLRGGKKLADTVTELVGSEKEAFLDLASGMLHWLPEKRKTAKELMQHPFFEELHKDRAQYYAQDPI